MEKQLFPFLWNRFPGQPQWSRAAHQDNQLLEEKSQKKSKKRVPEVLIITKVDSPMGKEMSCAVEDTFNIVKDSKTQNDNYY